MPIRAETGRCLVAVRGREVVELGEDVELEGVELDEGVKGADEDIMLV